MIGFQTEIRLDTEKFLSDEETRVVAEVVAVHSEKRRAEYRRNEKPIKLGLLGIEGYWSDSVPWYEWMTEPQVLQPCSQACGLAIHELVRIIAYQIRPNNWQVFSWMAEALEGREHEHRLGLAAALYQSTLKDMREQQRERAKQAGRASGKSRGENVRCTPKLVAKGYETLMATGTEERNIAAKLATRFNVTSNHIRKLRKQAKNQT